MPSASATRACCARTPTSASPCTTRARCSRRRTMAREGSCARVRRQRRVRLLGRPGRDHVARQAEHHRGRHRGVRDDGNRRLRLRVGWQRLPERPVRRRGTAQAEPLSRTGSDCGGPVAQGDRPLHSGPIMPPYPDGRERGHDTLDRGAGAPVSRGPHRMAGHRGLARATSGAEGRPAGAAARVGRGRPRQIGPREAALATLALRAAW